MRTTMAAMAIALGGCAIVPIHSITDTASDYNVAVERAKNQMFLLNVVRASERKPMYFTGISALRGGQTLQVNTGTFGIPVPGGPTATYSSTPSFDVAVHDSKAFWQGIKAPVPVATLKNYIEQGWPTEVVLFMLVRRIELGAFNVTNYPPDPVEVEAFRFVLRSLFGCVPRGRDVQCEIRFEQGSAESVGRPLDEDETSRLASLVEMNKEGLRLVRRECEDRYELVSKARSLHLASIFSLGDATAQLGAAENALCAARSALKSGDRDGALRHLRSAASGLRAANKQLCHVANRVEGAKELETLRTDAIFATRSASQAPAEQAKSDEMSEKVRARLQQFSDAIGMIRGEARRHLAGLGDTKGVDCDDGDYARSIASDLARLTAGSAQSTAVAFQKYHDELAGLVAKVSSLCIGVASPSGCNVTAYFRSPEAILYYLGEVMREYPGIKVRYCGNGSERPLFAVKRGMPLEPAFVTVNYEGDYFHIRQEPAALHGCERELTSLALTLVAQLFAQQTESTQAPATGAVTIVGPLPAR